MKKCKKCDNLVGTLFLECVDCEQVIHTRCTQTGGTPGGLVGDIFYVYTCEDCSDGEKFERSKMNWVDVMGVVMYNLNHLHYDRRTEDGYFHRDKQIKKFLSDKWSVIFPHMKSKRKTWRSMLYETLRKFPQYFKAKEPGKHCVWYKLASPDFLPNQPMLDRQNNCKNKKSGVKRKLEELEEDSDSLTDYDSSSHDADAYEENCLADKRLMSYNTDSMYSKSYVKPSARLSEFLFEEESWGNIGQPIGIEGINMGKNLEQHWPSFSQRDVDSEDSEETLLVDGHDGSSYDSESSRSLFTKNSESNFLPWISAQPLPSQRCEPMTPSEEAYELSNLSKRIKNSDLLSVAEVRLHRKLVVRKLKRERGLAVFNLDDWSRGAGRALTSTAPRVLDRFQKRGIVLDTVNKEQSFWTRLMGHTEQYTNITSPMTKRVLKAYIRLDMESRPLWLRLCEEIRSRGKDPPEPRSPIIYSYVRPQHISAVNSLAEQYFWPGINLSECLQYPDYSCVVLYKKLVVGFAFMVPDVDYNEAYISFILTRPEWRRAGIATFMLYHLIQTCIGKDITLHVSATNPALLLYQKFGFKVEEFVQDFYDKYLPVGSSECRHALFLRLPR